MKRSTWILTYTILGTTFWIPSIVMHGIRGADFGASRSDIILLTLLPIITAGLTLQILGRSQVGSLSRASIASWMLFGIWFFGPFCMMISASFSGGGFLSSEVWRSIALAAFLFGPYTFVMSTYDPTLGALLVVTIWFFVIGAVGLTRRCRPIAETRVDSASALCGRKHRDMASIVSTPTEERANGRSMNPLRRGYERILMTKLKSEGA